MDISMEPLTEHRGVSGPVVYGYLRLVRVSPARQMALNEALAAYCRQHELTLSGVFTERHTGSGPSAAFTGLIDVLELPGTYGVVLPAASHLGPKDIATPRQAQIAAAGARLLLVRGPGRRRPAGHGSTGPGPAPVRRRFGPAPTPALDTER
ncbi:MULTISPECIES: hypothetical protein [unclassified Streptomyces]|uniref:hypothetical protein n=1 Tax=unclassified Streptomyces TaxID=2593676 RepID=UPI001BE8D5C7|nr:MULTISPECIES: hypothetical protein [unclassified Streptomyces]MBT2402533.1 hypothetical protein [Streptomyces sp. ISL-21]MBT2611872.1 hypothetical protein [Streptomyces sp. ISL-87]